MSSSNNNTNHDEVNHKPSCKQEEVFLTMHLRKMQRTLNGTRERENYHHLIGLFCLLVLIYGAGASNVVPNHRITITLELWQLVSIGGWILVSLTIITIFRTSQFIILLYWMVVYWPLLAIITTLLLNGVVSPFSLVIVASLFVAAEVVTLILFVSIHYLYPWIVGTSWFLNKVGASQFWSIRISQSVACEDQTISWSMNYSGFFGWQRRHTCIYQGQRNEHGLPHGLGRWMDNAFNGEVLEGTWQNGKPIAPHISRQYGTGDTFSAVSIAYIMATDDDFHKNKFIPTNHILPTRYGVASVECSIYGHFYNNLPHASTIYGPHNIVGNSIEDTFVADCCRWLVHLENDDESNYQTFAQERVNSIPIHSYVRNTSNFDNGASTESTSFGPKQKYEDNRKALKVSNVCINTNDVEEQISTLCDQMLTNNALMCNEVGLYHKEALVYLPGFNSHLKRSLESLGQFMAMSWLSSKVYPICFAWPCGQSMSYLNATALSASENNIKSFLQLLKGLQSAGIQKVHFMTHSLGVLTLLAAFEDKPNGTRSDASLCFELESCLNHDVQDCIGETKNGETVKSDKIMLICKNIIMLNPDFPVDAFVDHSYVSIRRICSHITIVGDKTDQALFASQCLNGIVNRFGCRFHQQPSVLCEKSEDKSVFQNRNKFVFQGVIGRDLDKLFFPAPTTEDIGTTNSLASQFFLARPQATFLWRESSSGDHPYQEKRWLDVDVIDTTLLDTNIQEWRHSAFNMNPILLNDLKEVSSQICMMNLSVLAKNQFQNSKLILPCFASISHQFSLSFVFPSSLLLDDVLLEDLRYYTKREMYIAIVMHHPLQLYKKFS